MPVAAQKKEISSAQDRVKAGKELDKVEQSMTKLLQDSANRHNEKIWELLFESLQKQYQQGNEKLYLKQKYDTAALFQIASRTFTVAEDFDSIDALPDKKGRVKLKFRKQNATKLNTIRPNLYNGGAYYIRKHDYNTAYRLFSQYVEAADKPLFKDFDYANNDRHLPEAAYWAAYCGYKLNDSKKILHHTYLALKDTANRESMLQFLSVAYSLDKDTTRWLGTLKEGFAAFPLSDYFYPRLMEYYTSRKDWPTALSLTEKALQADSTDTIFLLAKSTIMLNTGKFHECFDICNKLLKKNSELPAACLNAGLAKFNEGVSMDKTMQMTQKNRKDIQRLYEEALPFLEKYRQLKPKDKDKWAMPLYTIYLNLNMGAKFDEIDKLLKQ